MGSIPVLKPREVITLLQSLGFVEVASAVLTNNSVIPMAGARQYQCMPEGIFRQFCYVRLPRTSD
jgi:hypothetical protein